MAKNRSKKQSVSAWDAALVAAEKSPAPVTVVCGPQEYFRTRTTDRLVRAVEATVPGIDVLVLHGPSSPSEAALPVRAVMDEIESKSLFSASKLVVVRQAQLFLFPQRGGDDAMEALERLVDYLDAPTEGMHLLVECESLNRSRRVGKAFDAAATVVECPELRYENDAVEWIHVAARDAGATVSPEAARMLFVAHGPSPGELAGEIEKLAVFTGDGAEITEDAVREFMGDAVALNIFDLTNAVEQRDAATALLLARRILVQGMTDRKGKPVDAVGSAHMALGAVQSCLMNIWRTHDILARGGGKSEVEQALGRSRRRAPYLMDAAKRYAREDIRDGFAALADGLAAAHDTGSDPELMLERVVLAVCGGAKV